MSRRLLTLLVAMALLAGAACARDGGDDDGGGGGDAGRGPSTTTTTAASPSPAAPADPRGSVRLTEVATFESPLWLFAHPSTGELHVVEKGGRIVTMDGEVVLDIRGEVGSAREQGLLGAAFHPTDDLLYINYTDTRGTTHMQEFRVESGRAAMESRREVLVVEQPFDNHNGGHLLFGRDGLLYIGLGDGGGAGDPEENAQELDTLLGKILRIDPRASGADAYTVPDDNPFAGQSGARAEIWAYGLRNPWRFSFDRETADLWIGDVGQRDWEEVDLQPAASRGGENYGWDLFEGTHRFEPGSTEGLVPPVYEYPQTGGNCSITGGYVYRGSSVEALHGRYVFADFCRGELLALVQAEGSLTAVPIGGRISQASSFGEDADGELYVVSLEGPVYRLDPA